MVNNKFWLVGFALAVPSASFIFNVSRVSRMSRTSIFSFFYRVACSLYPSENLVGSRIERR